jgi:hypothetical protein
MFTFCKKYLFFLKLNSLFFFMNSNFAYFLAYNGNFFKKIISFDLFLEKYIYFLTIYLAYVDMTKTAKSLYPNKFYRRFSTRIF